jgi:fatty-acyl-CoA synthase
VPVAVVAVTDNALQLADLEEFLTERLARYEHPKALEVVDALPRNPAGKVLKTQLRARYGAESITERGRNCASTAVQSPASRCSSLRNADSNAAMQAE